MKIRIVSLERNLVNLVFIGLILGWRGIEVMLGITIYPISFMIWAALLVYLFKNRGIVFIPRSILSRNISFVLALLTIIGVVTGLFQGNDKKLVIQEAIVFFDFFPLYFVLTYSLKTREEIMEKQKILIFAGVLISIAGVLEYFFPNISSLFPQIIKDVDYYRINVLSGERIHLGAFSSWGTPVVSVILVPLLGMLIPWIEFRMQVNSLLKWAAFLLLLVGIIISGYRSAWLGLCVIFFLMLLFGGKFERRLFVILFIFVVISVLNPNQFVIRAQSMFSPEIQTDHTVITRTTRNLEGLIRLVNNPILGTGWSSPAVFLDQLYIGISIGIPGLLLFLYWYAISVYKQWKYSRISVSQNDQRLAKGFVYALISCFFCMVSGALGQVPPLMSAFWLFFILGWRFLDISNKNHYIL